ncbi:MAG: pyrimidine reductase family protein [Pseudonocardia sp.]|nr:pyrimidine reductase family protein [Pseudonocardia sp.]
MRRLLPDPSPPDHELTDEELETLYEVDPLDLPTSRSHVRLLFVTSIDGAAEVDGRSAALSGPADKRVFRIVRDHCHGVLVGAGTVRAEGYAPAKLDPGRLELRRRRGLPDYPPVVIVSNRLSVEPQMPVFATSSARPVIVTSESSPPDRRRALERVADVVVSGDVEVDLADALTVLHHRGLETVLCEGGPRLAGALASDHLVDDLCLTTSPTTISGSATRMAVGPAVVPPARYIVRHVLVESDNLFTRYSR